MLSLLKPRRSETDSPERASQYLVAPEPEREKFGIQEMLAALLFALFVSGVSYIKAKADFDLYLVFGSSIFFLTATVLFFFNHGIHKISLFMTSLTKQIVYTYLGAMAVIVLILHLVPAQKKVYAMHAMLITLCAAETWINRIIASSFRSLSDQYREVAKVFHLAMVSAIVLLVLNAYVLLQQFLWMKAEVILPIINPYRYNLIALLSLQLLALIIHRDLVREGISRLIFENVRESLPQTRATLQEQAVADV